LESWALEECETWGLLSDDPLARPTGTGSKQEEMHLPTSPRLPSSGSATATNVAATAVAASGMTTTGTSVADQIRQFRETTFKEQERLFEQVREGSFGFGAY